MSSFRLKKKSRRLKQYSLWQLRFCPAQKPWKRKETERTYSLRTHFGALRGRDGEEEEPLASVVFPPSTIAKQCTKRHAAAHASHWSLWLPSMLSRPENGCIHAQAPIIAEPKHSQQIDRVRGDDVLAKEHRTSVFVGYSVKMKRRLCVSAAVQCAGCYFFFSEVDKDVVDPR